MRDRSQDKPLKRLHSVPETQGPRHKIIRLKGGEGMDACILSKKLWGISIHWDPLARRSEECNGDPSICAGCKVGKPEVPKFYLHVLSAQHGQCFIELPRDSADRVQDLLEGYASYRGVYIQIRRTPANNGRLVIRLLEREQKDENLPPEKDPEETLRLLWQWGRK
jgi:hypothetical protein